MSTQCVLVLKRQIFVVDFGPETDKTTCFAFLKQPFLLLYFDEHTVCACIQKQIFVVSIGPETVTKQLALLDKNNLFTVTF